MVKVSSTVRISSRKDSNLSINSSGLVLKRVIFFIISKIVKKKLVTNLIRAAKRGGVESGAICPLAQAFFHCHQNNIQKNKLNLYSIAVKYWCTKSPCVAS